MRQNKKEYFAVMETNTTLNSLLSPQQATRHLCSLQVSSYAFGPSSNIGQREIYVISNISENFFG